MGLLLSFVTLGRSEHGAADVVSRLKNEKKKKDNGGREDMVEKPLHPWCPPLNTFNASSCTKNKLSA